MKSLLSVLGFGLFLIVCIPWAARAGVVVSQDSCIAVGLNQVRVYFSVNAQLADDIVCSFNLTPSPSPASTACTTFQLLPNGMPTGLGAQYPWVWSPNHTDGGVWFGAPPTEYTGACISGKQGGFYITIDPSGACCYEASFANHLIQRVDNVTWCVTPCVPLPVRGSTWGAVKSLYRN